jgi:hypothetical protein
MDHPSGCTLNRPTQSTTEQYQRHAGAMSGTTPSRTTMHADLSGRGGGEHDVGRVARHHDRKRGPGLQKTDRFGKTSRTLPPVPTRGKFVDKKATSGKEWQADGTMNNGQAEQVAIR